MPCWILKPMIKKNPKDIVNEKRSKERKEEVKRERERE